MSDLFARQRTIVGTTAEWAAHDLTLGAGEIALERHTDGSITARVGNGVSPFSTSPLLVPPFPAPDVRREVIHSLTGTPLSANEILGVILPPIGETWTYPANLSTSSGKRISGGTPPAATDTIRLLKNGVQVGTITLATSGAVTFATSGGTPFSLTGGADELEVVGNPTPSVAVGYVFTFVATWS